MDSVCAEYKSTKKGEKENYGSVLQFENKIFHAAGTYKGATGQNYYWRCSVKKPLRCKRRLVTQQKPNGSYKIIQITGVHCHDSSVNKIVKYKETEDDSIEEEESDPEEEETEEESCEESDAQPLFNNDKKEQTLEKFGSTPLNYFNNFNYTAVPYCHGGNPKPDFNNDSCLNKNTFANFPVKKKKIAKKPPKNTIVANKKMENGIGRWKFIED